MRFAAGWPAEITYGELKPFYDKVAKFMNVQQVPGNQWTERMKLMKEGAEKTGNGGRFKQLELAVTFDAAWNYEQADPFNVLKSKRFVNEQGVEQGTCVHLGNCDLGVRRRMRRIRWTETTFPWAEKHGAEVRPLHLVHDVSPTDGGYRVSFDRIDSGARVAGSVTARIVVIAAGSLGSTELLAAVQGDQWDAAAGESVSGAELELEWGFL